MITAEVQNKVSDVQQIRALFESQKANQYAIGNSSVSERRTKLSKLHKTILHYRTDIKKALHDDFRKHPSEVDMTDIYPVISEIKHAKSHLASWMKDQSVHTPLALLGSSSYIKYEPKGVVLIISPWNFPFNLTFGPFVSAIAAGNCVMIKPSEMTPHIAKVMHKIVTEVFEPNEVALIEGGIETSTELLKLSFNHIFFTGAPSIGKVVMEAAAKNLTSVTLELGGKSPTIVDETADLELAAKRIAWAKWANNGQICIAPDFVYVHESQKDKFLSMTQKYIQQYYGNDAATEPSYNRIVNRRHFDRLKSYIDDAVSKGANIITGGQLKEAENFIAPMIMTNVDKKSALMTNEIFGPILPVYTYDKLEDLVEEIRSGEKPLALYIFSKNNKNINYILNNTRAGGGCINHCAVHFYNTNLPFGGSNNSGIGKSHGFEGFKSFSNGRGILKQHLPNALELLVPPFNTFKQKIIDLTIKYF
ncbi:MAG: aldehyde dehydrogenase family protein [Saprospiraceae bacterium]|nr:aldehyde dehydrogenase family protein [Saprospiraceae bacterium]